MNFLSFLISVLLTLIRKIFGQGRTLNMMIRIVYIMYGAYTVSSDVLLTTNSCPENEKDYFKRTNTFLCYTPSKKYHCVLDDTNQLVEICIAPMDIHRNMLGCPSVSFLQSSYQWKFPLTKCPIRNPDCPQKDHEVYSTEQLYKHPVCYRNLTDRLPPSKVTAPALINKTYPTHDAEMEITTNVLNDRTNISKIVTGVAAIIFIISISLGYCLYVTKHRKKQWNQKMCPNQSTEALVKVS